MFCRISLFECTWGSTAVGFPRQTDAALHCFLKGSLMIKKTNLLGVFPLSVDSFVGGSCSSFVLRRRTGAVAATNEGGGGVCGGVSSFSG